MEWPTGAGPPKYAWPICSGLFQDSLLALVIEALSMGPSSGYPGL
jgi:hypothetical protein